MKKIWRDLPVFAQAVVTSDDSLAVTDFKAWRLKEPASGRRYTVLRLKTRGGLTGYGEGLPALPGEIEHAKAAIIGRSSHEFEFVRFHLAAVPAMEAAVNNALLDIMARSASVPVYQYLGGPTRSEARVLGHLEGNNEAELLPEVERVKGRGYKAFAFAAPARDSMTTLQQYVDKVKGQVVSLRAAGGEDSDFVLNGAGSFSPGDAAMIATALEKIHLLWFDEPTSVLTNDALAKITDESVMPIGLGRNVHELAVFQNLLRWGCVDVLRPEIGRNSIQKIRRVAAIGETHYVAVAPHHSGGPIGSVAAIHLAASLPNFFIQQIPQPASDQDREMRMAITSGDHERAEGGFAPLLNKPGLGIQVDEGALNKYSEATI